MAVGLIGLGVMGRNLALNWRDAGHEVVATDSWESARAWRAKGVMVCDDLPFMIAALPAPRVILLMVKAGEHVDFEIANLVQHIGPGDTILDGGNSHYRDTERRAASLAARGIGYLGVGTSGGAEGARHGAAMMVGGSQETWERARPVLEAVAARAGDGVSTVDRFGDGGAGHFVKMVHNGIEYAIMQGIAECHLLLTGGAGFSAEEAAATLARWNEGRGAGFLLEISAEIANAADPMGEGVLLDRIRDVAGQKGTGGWTVDAAIEHGIAIPSIMEAVTARQLSGEAAARTTMTGQAMSRDALAREGLADDLEAALTGTMIAALSQGLHLYAVAAQANGWDGDLARVLRVWRAGSILRMELLDMLVPHMSDGMRLPLENPAIAGDMATLVPRWRRAVAGAVGAGYPVGVLGGTLSYVEALGTATLPTAMIQAQRDRFGAHGFARTDREGRHHGPWVFPDKEAGA